MNIFSKITLSNKKTAAGPLSPLSGYFISGYDNRRHNTHCLAAEFYDRNVIATDGDWHVQFMELTPLWCRDCLRITK